MLAHIHPHPSWFACESSPLFHGFVPFALCPGRSKTRHVPRAPLPDEDVTPVGVTSPASRQRELPLFHRSYELMRQTLSLPLSSVYPIQRVLAGCYQSLLGKGPSRRYLCNPCIGAWTLTPGCLSGASVRFFPESYSLAFVAQSSAHPSPVARQLPRRPIFGAAVISLCSGPCAC
jgi:hypothetical protein